jgi:hypothetical protein
MENAFWLDEPEQHDYPAAQDYLELLYPDHVCSGIVERLQKAQVIRKKAKDILRASELPLLKEDNVHVSHNIQKAKKGVKLSPILLVRDRKLVIADGYHRLCAIYYLSEDQSVPCKLTDIAANPK